MGFFEEASVVREELFRLFGVVEIIEAVINGVLKKFEPRDVFRKWRDQIFIRMS